MREAEPFYPVGNRNRVKFPQPPGPGPLAPSDYPVRDGNPMAETPIHWHATYDAALPLHRFFKSRSDVYVGSDMLLYYREGDVNGNVVPDVWVAFGVAKLPERRTWLLWLEGKGPDFVLEITSKSTRREDAGPKKRLYAQLGVREYWQFDPTGDYLDPILKGRELGPDGKYRDLVLKERDGVLRHPSLLGLDLCLEDGRLYYFDPVRKVRLLTNDEKDAAWQQEKHARQQEKQARQNAEKAAQTMRAERDRELAARRTAEVERDRESDARQAAEVERDRESAARHTAEAKCDRESAARHMAEAERDRESAARQAAEARIAELERKLGGK